MEEGYSRRPPRYRLYIDESGDHTYGSLDDPAHRYLALLGVWFRQANDYVTFADALEGLKRVVFGPSPDEPVVLHRSDIVNRRGRFAVLRDAVRHAAFDEGLLDLIIRSRFTMVCVVIDKRDLVESYEYSFHPYHYCLAAMLDRYCGWLNYWNAVGDVMVESRGGYEDTQLKSAYKRVYDSGTLLFPADHHQQALTSSQLKLRPKTANIAGLQLADVLAHPVKQWCLWRRGIIEKPSGFGGRLVEAVQDKLNRKYGTEEVDGYGAVWLPRKQMKTPPGRGTLSR